MKKIFQSVFVSFHLNFLKLVRVCNADARQRVQRIHPLSFSTLILTLTLTTTTFAQDGSTGTTGISPGDTTTQYSRAQIDSTIQAIRNLFDELLDIEVGKAALQARHISNVGYGIDNTIGLNRELRDTFAMLRDIVQSEFFIKSAIHYDHFYTRLLNRKNYSPNENEIGRQFGGELYAGQIYFDVVFSPGWDTLAMDVDAAREANKVSWKCNIEVKGMGTFNAEFSSAEMDSLMRPYVSGKNYADIKREAAADANQGLFAGLGWLAKKFGFEPYHDPSNIKRVDFTAPVAQGYDQYDNKGILFSNYENIAVDGKQYFVPWKSAKANGNSPEYVFAQIVPKDTGKPVEDSIEFVSLTGAPVTNVIKTGDFTYKIQLPNMAPGDGAGIMARYRYTDSTGKEVTMLAGQVGIATYTELPKSLVIVPVISDNLPIGADSVKNFIDRVYGPAGVDWTVTVASGFRYTPAWDDGTLDDGQSGTFSNYTAEMNDLIDAFKDFYGSNYDKNRAYLFLVEKPKSGSKCGYMPLTRRFGFIFTDQCTTELAHTIAHELGHGPFHLYHTFSTENGFTQAQGSTDNLMDYSGASATSLYKYQWDYIQDPQAMIGLLQGEEEGEYVEEGPISEVTRFFNTIACAKNKNIETVNIHHSVNGYSVKVGDILGQLNKYRGSSPSIASDEFKKAYLKVYIDEGMFSSASDLYLGYHNFQLSVNDYERKPAQGIDSEQLIFTANGKPIIFSFPAGTDAGTQKDVLDWIEREGGVKTGGRPFESIRFNAETDDIKDLFSLSTCQLEQINKEDRKKLIEKTLENVENFLGLDKDSYQYLLANLIMSTPKADVEDLISYLSGIGGELESTFLDLAPTAQEVFVQGLCELAKKSWESTQYLGGINSYLLGLQAIQKDEHNRIRLGVCGMFSLQPGKYEFSYSVWASDDGMFPSNGPDPQGTYELSAFDPVECHIVNDNAEVESTQIIPAIVVKLYAVNLHIANIDQLLDIPKMVILPEFSGTVFLGAERLGKSTVTLFKGFTKGLTSATGKFLGKCGKLGYRLKQAGTEVALYTNLNVEIARFSGTGKLMTKVYPYTKTGTRVMSWDDEVEFISTANSNKKGYVELIESDGGLIFREVSGEVVRHENWVEVIDITNKVENLVPHVLEVERQGGAFITKTITKNRQRVVIEGFQGCHTENALKEFVEANGGTYVIKNKSVGAGGVYEGQPVIYLNGKEYVKTNGALVEYEPGKWGGTSSFFPEGWSNERILEEVKYAVENNHGLVPGQASGGNLMFGYSKDGIIEIRFAFNANGKGTYYAIKK